MKEKYLAMRTYKYGSNIPNFNRKEMDYEIIDRSSMKMKAWILHSNLLIYKVKYSLHFKWMTLSKELIFWAKRLFI